MSDATLHEIQMRGIEALSKELDPVDLARFFQYYEKGTGDYTKEKAELFKDYDADRIVREIKELREKKDQ